MRRLDSAAAKVNPFLTVIAIGLATITLASFSMLAIKEMLPPITQVSCPEPTSVPPGVSQSVTTGVSRRQVITGGVDDSISNRPMRNL
jgi:hypothetical protein